MGATLVVQTAFLGDVVLTTPLVRSLARSAPVDIVTTPAGSQLLAGNPHIRSCIPYDKRGIDAGMLGLFRFARAIRARGPYERILLAQSSHRSAALARLVGAPEVVGFATAAGRWASTRRVPPSHELHHAARLLLLGGFEPGRERLRPELFPSADDVRRALTLVTPANPGERPWVALAPGSVWGTKRWPHYPELAKLLKASARIVVIGAAADQPLAREILAATDHEGVDATGQLTLLQSAALLTNCAALVTNDSAPLHLASAMNTPTVAVFGPTVPAFGFGPLASTSAVAEHKTLACRPCHSHGPPTCPKGHFSCMRDLKAPTVFELVRAILPSVA